LFAFIIVKFLKTAVLTVATLSPIWFKQQKQLSKILQVVQDDGGLLDNSGGTIAPTDRHPPYPHLSSNRDGKVQFGPVQRGFFVN